MVGATPLSPTSRSAQPDEESGIDHYNKRDNPNRAGVNIYKSLVTVGGKTTGRIAVSGMIEVSGALGDAFSSTTDIALSAFSHLKQTMGVTPFNSLNAVFFIRDGTWIPSYGKEGAIRTAVLVEYTSRTLIQLTQNDLDLVATAIKNYFSGFRCGVSIRPQVDDAFAGFPTGRPTRRDVGEISLNEREANDLQGQQVCANPVDVRSYYSDKVPGMTTDVIAC